MVALLGAESALVQELAEAHAVQVANDNSPRQQVLSGPGSRLAGLAADARRLGLRCVPLAVQGAFHSPAMAGAVEEFEAALATVEFDEPELPVYSCITAAPFDDIRARLAEALVSTVRWRETLHALFDSGARRFVDVGPGRVMCGLVKHTLSAAETLTAAP